MTTPPALQDQPATTPVAKPRNWYKISLIVILVIIALSLGIITYFLFSANSPEVTNRQPTEATPTPTSTPTPTPTATPTPTPNDPLAGWQTFTSDRYGFVVRHPQSVTVSRQDSDYNDDEYYTHIHLATQTNLEPSTSPIFIFYQFPAGCGPTGQDPTTSPESTKQVQFNGRQVAVKPMCTDSGPYTLLVRDRQGRDMYIWLNYLQNTSADQNLFNQITANITGFELR